MEGVFLCLMTRKGYCCCSIAHVGQQGRKFRPFGENPQQSSSLITCRRYNSTCTGEQEWKTTPFFVSCSFFGKNFVFSEKVVRNQEEEVPLFRGGRQLKLSCEENVPLFRLYETIMRLTLRTILAYLDDVLEPAQARELGEKIAESKEAADLMSRIREVLRRRRIGAPELAGPGSGPDPNMVSDYLENLLPPEQVVELERLCQASDVHLAEVAACHKILSMVMGSPIDVSDEMRERMYALGAAKTVPETVESAVVPAMSEGMSGVDPQASTGIPEYLIRKSFFQQYGLVTLVVLCVVFWTALVLTDQGLWARRPVGEQQVASASSSAGKSQSAVASAGAGTGQNQTEVPGGGTTPATPNSASNDAPGKSSLAAANSSPMVPPLPTSSTPAPGILPSGTPVPGTAVSPVIATTSPAMSAAPSVSPAAVPMPPQPNRPALPAADLPPESPFTYQSGDEFDIKRLAGQGDWIVHPINIPIEVDDEFASPAPFRNSYSIVNKVDVTLEPGTRLQRLPRSANTILGLALNRGQFILFRPFTTADQVAVEILAAGRSRIMTLLHPGTRVAVELALPQTTGPVDANTKLTPTGGMVVVKGRIRVSTQGLPDLEIGEQDGYARWPTDRGELVLQADLGVPGWAQQNDLLVTPAARQLSRLYQKEFISDRTISQSIGPVVSDRRAGISELAVKTLSLLDQYPYLVTALQSDHQESRLAAIHGLRAWLGEDPDVHGALLPEELSKVFRNENVATLTRLLWGYGIQDARNPEISRQLIDWMKDDQLAIRQLAFEFVSRTVGKTYDYLPIAPPAERRAALGRWEDYLKRNGGALLPSDPVPADVPAAAPVP